MARREIVTLKLYGRSTQIGIPTWAERTEDSALVSSPATDGINIATHSTTWRLRWRNDLTLQSLIEDSEGRNWFPTEFKEVEDHRFIDVACSSYETVNEQRPPDVSPYTAQTGYTLAKDGAPVQFLQVAYVQEDEDVSYPVVWFINDGASGVFDQIYALSPNGKRLQVTPGRLNAEGQNVITPLTVSSSDEYIPRLFKNGPIMAVQPAQRDTELPIDYTPSLTDWLYVLPSGQ